MSYHSLPQEPDESYDRSFDRYQDHENQDTSSYGYNYNNYRPPPSNSLKGKVESKYWHTKQSVIQKLGKEQDVFVVAGDAEVDARLEAFRHIQKTCIDLLKAIEIYQNRIFALSQDENEMGRFLREQGSQDKSKAGKMMIAVGKSQSYTAQQRLSLRTPLVRLYQEIETFRFRAISDTAMTVGRMESSRTEYRASLLWMADLSKELDPEEWKRLDKFREVQTKVKSCKKKFEKNKHDVMQKVDLLSASRCNLLSSTLAAYQQAMLKFWENTSKSMSQVAEQFKGYPVYQFQMLKSLNPLLDGDDKDETKEEKGDEETQQGKDDEKNAEEATEQKEDGKDDDDDDDKLICLDNSPVHKRRSSRENTEDDDDELLETDLLGEGSGEQKANGGQAIDLLGGEEEQPSGSADLLGSFNTNDIEPPSYEAAKDLLGLDKNFESRDGHMTDSGATAGMTADDLLFGSPSRQPTSQSDLDLLSDVFGDNQPSQVDQNSFSSKWNELFGDGPKPQIPSQTIPSSASSAQAPNDNHPGYLPSDLMDSLLGMDPFGSPADTNRQQAASNSSTNGTSRNLLSGLSMPTKSSLKSLTNIGKTSSGKEKPSKGGDQSAWFNLFSDLDPLANPDAIGQGKKKEDERSC
ncbi:islet cell autoantigen 1 isoform X2 [Exaiptasia diaphana]|uniref:AH domain-containing protein n=1 Tax=Exaiptasia diaphana TaxID=2652724 RepID=A0A913YM94_EXADI|nr:islet cell autoantigen 1 isoform X2 [Exaiptasia diaphana]